MFTKRKRLNMFLYYYEIVAPRLGKLWENLFLRYWKFVVKLFIFTDVFVFAFTPVLRYYAFYSFIWALCSCMLFFASRQTLFISYMHSFSWRYFHCWNNGHFYKFLTSKRGLVCSSIHCGKHNQTNTFHILSFKHI